MTTVFTTFSVLKNYVKLKAVQDTAVIDNIVFRLHYRATFVLLVVGSLLVSSKQFFGEHIKCLAEKSKDDRLSAVIDTFCFFSSTYTITKYMDAKTVNANHIPHPGIGPYTGEEETVHHAYYQWVPFVLFFQALVFYVPHYLWRGAEGGRLKALVSGLHMASLSLADNKDKDKDKKEEKDKKGDKDKDKKEDEKKKSSLAKSECKEKIKSIHDYFVAHLRVNQTWAYYLGACEILNFINVILQIYITNWFLGGAFLSLGTRVMETDEWTSRMSPLDIVFPKVTKCTFHRYGPSGSVEQLDALCVMALNIVNEKIYVFLWFWYIILAVLSGIAIFWRIAALLLYSRSGRFNCFVFSMACPGKVTPWNTLRMARGYHFGDWLFLYYLAKNLDNHAFTELLRHFKNEKEPLPNAFSSDHSNTYIFNEKTKLRQSLGAPVQF
ncbi:innexin inx7 [Fopius arisanus]|uniref:Innexin n=1 Tax=Fopius arisanus TaxID=64838 RepID=A0A9R1TWW2_9HYME|nr:PREDICTED: innexin inx7-like [Fopius arisanus]